MSKVLRYSGLILLLIVLAVCGWVGYGVMNAPSTVKMDITYAQMPPDDQSLTGWLSSQPQIKKVSASRSGQTLTVSYQMPRKSTPPDVIAACDRFGYQGRGGYTTHTQEVTWP